MSSNFRLAGPEQTYGKQIIRQFEIDFFNTSLCAHKESIPFTWYPDDYRLCAFGVVSEYLLPELAEALQVCPT